MILERDTIYFRHDHPNGFMFSAGSAAPDGEWFAAPGDVPDEAPLVYECSSLAAFSELLRTEREGSFQLANELRTAMQRLAAATHVVAELQTENARLNDEIAALHTAEEEP